MTAEQANRARHEKARAAGENRRLPVPINHADDEDDDRGARNGRRTAEKFSTMLGFVSIGLGLTELIAPGVFNRAIGIRPNGRNRATTRMLGLREIGNGVGMLLQPRRAEWAWGRVAGDAMDIAMLGVAMKSRKNNRTRLQGAAIATLGIAAVDFMCARELSMADGHESDADVRRIAPLEEGIRVRKSITINRPAEEVYAYWRNFENLPRFMKHLESVDIVDGTQSHWTAKAPAGRTVSWNAHIVADEPNQLIAWESEEGADVVNSGVVRFLEAPGGRGTEVHVNLAYDPPAGRLGALVAKLFGEEPAMQVADDLRRFKQVLETGEVVHSDASIHEGMHPAQPSRTRDVDPAIHDEVALELIVERAADARHYTSNANREFTTATKRGESAITSHDGSNDR